MAGFEGAPLRRGACPWRDRVWLGVPGLGGVARRTVEGAALLQRGLAERPESAVRAVRRVDDSPRDFMVCVCLRVCVCVL